MNVFSLIRVWLVCIGMMGIDDVRYFHYLQPSDAFTIPLQLQRSCRLGPKCNINRRRCLNNRQPCDRNRNNDVRSTDCPVVLEASTTLLENNEPALLELPNLELDVLGENGTSAQPIDKRPHEQRVSGPRKARRMNHPFQHLYRHSDPWWEDNDWNDTIAAASDEVYEFYKTTLDTDASKEGQSQSNSTFAQQPIDVRTSLSAIQYLNLHGGYTFEEIQRMHARFPPLLEMDALRHFRPKMRFLKDCLGGCSSSSSSSSSTNTDDDDEQQLLNPELKAILPGNFFGSRLERTIAPRHAFLVHVGLPFGKALWDDTYKSKNGSDGRGGNNSGGSQSLLEEFLLMHRKPKQFAALCNKWKNIYGSTTLTDNLPITSEQIVAFDKLFQRGILSAARDDSAYVQPPDETTSGDTNKNKTDTASTSTSNNSPSLLQTANVTSAQLVRYLIQHGANPWETDVRGASLFHWAAGCGNLAGLQELVDGCDQLASRMHVARETDSSDDSNSTTPRNPGVHAALLWKASRDDATPLHWAAAGAGPKEFGIGGHISVCNYILSLCSEYQIISERKLINSQTRDGNTILMWSAWSRSLDIVKLLVRSRADTLKENRNGCTVAHWAASGGDLSVCKYLHKMANIDFTVENYARNTPLSHTVAYGRFEVAKWLKEDLKVEDTGGNAEDLASDFVNWADMGVGLIAEEEEMERRSVYSLFNSFNDWRDEETGESENDREE